MEPVGRKKSIDIELWYVPSNSRGNNRGGRSSCAKSLVWWLSYNFLENVPPMRRAQYRLNSDFLANSWLYLAGEARVVLDVRIFCAPQIIFVSAGGNFPPWTCSKPEKFPLFESTRSNHMSWPVQQNRWHNIIYALWAINGVPNPLSMWRPLLVEGNWQSTIRPRTMGSAWHSTFCEKRHLLSREHERVQGPMRISTERVGQTSAQHTRHTKFHKNIALNKLATQIEKRMCSPVCNCIEILLWKLLELPFIFSGYMHGIP